MKKFLALLLVFALLALSLAACSPVEPDGGDAAGGNTPGNDAGTNDDTSDKETEGTAKTTIRLAGMTGPTSIGMAKLLADNNAGTAANEYSFTLAADGAAIKTKLLNGEVDVAAIPANLAAALHKATGGKIVLLAVNTLGVVSLIEKGNTVESFADLRGKTVFAPVSAKGAIPDLVFNYLLKQNGMDPANDLTIEWVEASALAAKLKTVEGAVALSPQPNATALLKNVEGAREAINLNDAWHALENGSEYITGVLVCRKAFLEQNTAAVNAMLTEYEASIRYANEHVSETAELVRDFRILELSSEILVNAIPACHISFMAGAEMKSAVSTYLDLLLPLSPAAFGGVKPDDSFYYIGQ